MTPAYISLQLLRITLLLLFTLISFQKFAVFSWIYRKRSMKFSIKVKGLLHKLKNNGIYGNFLCLTESMLHNRYQRVSLNGQSSIQQNINDGVQQRSVLIVEFFVATFKFCQMHGKGYQSASSLGNYESLKKISILNKSSCQESNLDSEVFLL